jgi:hypothetical protein
MVELPQPESRGEIQLDLFSDVTPSTSELKLIWLAKTQGLLSPGHAIKLLWILSYGSS